jgi:signal transduction histidine kinase
MTLHELLAAHRALLIERTRAKVRRSDALPTDDALMEGIPLFLDRLIADLWTAQQAPDGAARGTPALRSGGLTDGHRFTVSGVARAHGYLGQVVLELADERSTAVSAAELRVLDRCFDDAVAGAVTAHYLLEHRHREEEETERLGALAHELRNRLSAAMLAFSAIKSGRVPFAGSTGQMLWRNLRGLQDRVDHALSQVRLESGAASLTERVAVARLLDEVEVEASLDATERQMSFTVAPVASDVSVLVDPAILNAAVINLVQNAFKFSPPSGRVSLTTSATPDRVLLEVEDECGGLPAGATEVLFHPYVQMGKNRRGLGLGLVISRRAVESFGGELRVRDLPGRGCIFTIDLPRCRGSRTARAARGIRST